MTWKERLRRFLSKWLADLEERKSFGLHSNLENNTNSASLHDTIDHSNHSAEHYDH